MNTITSDANYPSNLYLLDDSWGDWPAPLTAAELDAAVDEARADNPYDEIVHPLDDDAGDDTGCTTLDLDTVHEGWAVYTGGTIHDGGFRNCRLREHAITRHDDEFEILAERDPRIDDEWDIPTGNDETWIVGTAEGSAEYHGTRDEVRDEVTDDAAGWGGDSSETVRWHQRAVQVVAVLDGQQYALGEEGDLVPAEDALLSDVAERWTIVVDPSEPGCTHDDGHEWIGYAGAQGHGGGVRYAQVCRYCGTISHVDTWAQDRETGEQGLDSERWEDADGDSITAAVEHGVEHGVVDSLVDSLSEADVESLVSRSTPAIVDDDDLRERVDAASRVLVRGARDDDEIDWEELETECEYRLRYSVADEIKGELMERGYSADVADGLADAWMPAQ